MTEMQTVYELSALPPVDLSTMTEGEDYLRPVGRGFLRVRVQITAGAGTPSVAVRPYQRFANGWWPLRADGAADVGVKPVTATRGSYNNRAEGLFQAVSSRTPTILVLESGSLADVAAVYLGRGDVDP